VKTWISEEHNNGIALDVKSANWASENNHLRLSHRSTQNFYLVEKGGRGGELNLKLYTILVRFLKIALWKWCQNLRADIKLGCMNTSLKKIYIFWSFLGEFAKLRKATISIVVSVRLSVRMEQLGSHWTDFHEIWYLRIFRKSVTKIHLSLQSDKNNGFFTQKPIYIFIISPSFLTSIGPCIIILFL